MELGVYYVCCLYPYFGKFASVLVTKGICVCYYFTDGNVVAKVFLIVCILQVIRSLLGWLYWEEGFPM